VHWNFGVPIFEAKDLIVPKEIKLKAESKGIPAMALN
jgi:hypothetical protein